MIEASFVTSWNFAPAKWLYFHGESVKKNIAEVVAMLDPNSKKTSATNSRNISFTPHYRDQFWCCL